MMPLFTVPSQVSLTLSAAGGLPLPSKTVLKKKTLKSPLAGGCKQSSKYAVFWRSAEC